MIKICGMTRREDAQSAVRHGATAVGFIFWRKSPRWIAPQAAAEIVQTLPGGVMTVGVFVDATPDEMLEVATVAGLQAIQLHGHEPPSYASMPGLKVIKALDGKHAADADAWPADTLVLLDAIDPALRGGTGTKIDWAAAAVVARQRPVILAGGLTAENVADAVARVRPWGVDVSSGVERSPGVKDDAQVRRFIAEARRAFDAIER